MAEKVAELRQSLAEREDSAKSSLERQVGGPWQAIVGDCVSLSLFAAVRAWP